MAPSLKGDILFLSRAWFGTDYGLLILSLCLTRTHWAVRRLNTDPSDAPCAALVIVEVRV